MRAFLRLAAAACFLAVSSEGRGETRRVPADFPTIQAAIEASAWGDHVLVAPGRYRESLRLKPGVTLRGDTAPFAHEPPWRRAERVVLDGGGAEAGSPGVEMAEGSTLEEMTVTNVGLFEEARWKRHYESQGEELDDEEGAVRAEGSLPAVQIAGVRCVVRHCVVHHNGDVGIGILGTAKSRADALVEENLVYRNMGGGIGVAEGGEPVVRRNTCRENLRAGIGCRAANPVLLENECHENIRAGIGCREGAAPIMRGNKCSRNRRAGIGIRMEGTSPLVEGNECWENAMAGIGCRDGATPLIRGNLCRENAMAGIGCRDGAAPMIVGNECRGNAMAGIGVQQRGRAVILDNKCLDNRLVAIGVVEESRAEIGGNELTRRGGVPPLLAVKGGSRAVIRENQFSGGGVAALLLEGEGTITGNTFTGAGEGQGNAVWVWEGSRAVVSGNTFRDYRSAVKANKSEILVSGNTITGFSGTAITIGGSTHPAHVFDNTGASAAADAKLVEVEGPAGVVERNGLRRE